MNALAWTLIHFLWQGTAIAAALALVLRGVSSKNANFRYLLACGAMLVMLISACSTFFWLNGAAGVEASNAGRLSSAVDQSDASKDIPALAPQSPINGYLPWLVYLWFAGVVALSIRSAAGFVFAQRLKRSQARPVPDHWRQRFEQLAQRLQVRQKVSVCESALAEVPAIVGWFRPVVLVPASALTGLPPAALEALLAHELAHVRRHDYLVNLVQTAIETLLFYHPAVWWVGASIRAERENCCDDLAVAVSGDVLTYVRALADLEHLRPATPQLSMAANNGSLLNRIRRLVRPQQSSASASSDWVTGIAILLSAVGIWASSHARLAQTMTGQPLSPVRVSLAALPGPQADPAPAPEPPSETPEAEAAPPEPPQAPEAAPPSEGFLSGLASAGYKDLSVHQLIAFKIHGVTPEFIKSMQAVGFKPNPDELVAMRIHGVEASQATGFKAAGLGSLTVDQLIAARIHGLTPEIARETKAAGLGDPTFDQLLAMQIHGVTPEFIREMKAANVRGLTFDTLLAMRIHGVDSAFVQEAQKHGFKDLSADRLIELKIHNIFGSGMI